jgi:hypothetical protein
MNHPDLDRLTAWVHGFLEPADADGVEEHVSSCGECRDNVADLRHEADFLSRQITDPQRLTSLKENLLRVAAGKRTSRGLLWQIPVAAAVLAGLLGVLLWPGTRHSLVDGRVALEDGRVVSAPADLAASGSWQLRAVEPASVRLSDRSTVDLGSGARISLAPGGARGVQPSLSSGEATFSVAPAPQRLSVIAPSGRVEASDGRFLMKIVIDEEGEDAMRNALAGALVTVFAGSVSLSNAEGTVEAQPGQSAALARAEAPLLLTAPQDKQEELLRRLEQLAARVAKLEDEVAQLEQKNKQLKQQLTTNAPGSAWSIAPGQTHPGGVRVIQAAGGSAPGGVIILQEEEEKKSEPKSDPNRKR